MDFYQLLGVSKNASLKEIKKAFKEKAKKYHPDINKEGEEYFKLLVKAYETLSDPKKRKKYDESISTKNSLISKIEKIAERFLSEREKKDGKDIHIDVAISLEQAYSGAVLNIEYERDENCTVCNTTGLSENSSIERCEVCKGNGYIQLLSINLPCYICRGKGHIIQNPCPSCKGKRQVKVKKSIQIKLPAGIEENLTLMFEKKANQGLNGGKDGDLYVKIKIKPHSTFKKSGNDLITSMKLTPQLLSRGYFVVYNLKNEKIKVKLPENAKSGDIIRIKEEGYKDRFGNTGDILVKLI